MRSLVLGTLAAMIAAASAAPIHTFGTGLSAAQITHTEMELFNHTLSSGSDWGAMTHFWITGGAEVDYAVIRYYVDGESTPSIEFMASYAHGVGFDDQDAPWSAGDLFGKGSALSAWFNHIKIPFYHSIRVTYQLPSFVAAPSTAVYIIVRGAENVPVQYHGVTIPTSATMGGQAKLQLQVVNETVPALDFINLVSVPAGQSAYVLFDTLTFEAPNWNTLEGCFRMYTNNTGEDNWPGILLSTGTEDYYSSSYYFAVPGNFHFPSTGLTHKVQGTGSVQFSAYKTHLMSPLASSNGLSLNWRNGDMTDKTTGHKCFTASGGNVVGSPGTAQVASYGWVYVW